MKRYIFTLMMIISGLAMRAETGIEPANATGEDEAAVTEVAEATETVEAAGVDSVSSASLEVIDIHDVYAEVMESAAAHDTLYIPRDMLLQQAVQAQLDTVRHYTCPYFLPYSMTYSSPNWKRLWLNTGVLCGAYVSTLLVLECLPEDATSWNRAELQKTPPFNRWWDNIFVKGPEWDHDKFYFNYILHPYAGAVYFMGARSCGFNFYQSLLYSAIISTVGWEFGIEAFMERPSYQDIFITPLVGSLIGEGFYKIKRHIVDNGYELAGSKVLGNIVVFVVDPINEVIGLFAGNDARQKHCITQAEIDGELPQTVAASDFEPVSSHFWVTGNSVGIGIKAMF